MTHDSVAVRGSLANAGKRLTPERKLLIEIIARHPHSDALEIHDLARARSPRIGLATVYRTLRLLEDLDVVEGRQLGEDHSHYEVRDRDHLHVVCAKCGAVLDLPLPTGLRRIARKTGFTITRARLELVGLCASCTAKGNA